MQAKDREKPVRYPVSLRSIHINRTALRRRHQTDGRLKLQHLAITVLQDVYDKQRDRHRAGLCARQVVWLSTVPDSDQQTVFQREVTNVRHMKCAGAEEVRPDAVKSTTIKLARLCRAAFRVGRGDIEPVINDP